LIITCLWRSLYTRLLEFAEFAHQYSIVKDLKYSTRSATSIEFDFFTADDTDVADGMD